MSKFQMWWTLKGEDKTKRIIGKTCRWFFYCLLILFAWSLFIVSIIEHGWQALWLWGVGVLFILIVLAAIFWGDK